MAILVQGRPQVRGASLIAVNAFREYADAELASAPDVSGSKPQLITQDMLIRIDRDSQDFINAALGNARARLAGLDGYRLRPGVDIVSDPLINPAGNLTVVGDLDLSGLRYGPGSDRNDPAARLRRTGRAEHPRGRRPDHSRQHQRRLAPPPSTPDDQGWYLFEWRNAQNRQHAVRRRYRDSHRRRVAGQGHRVPQGRRAELRPAGRGRHLARASLAGWPATMCCRLGADVLRVRRRLGGWRAGTVPTADVTLAPGMKLGAGTVLRAETLAAALTWPGRGLARADDGQRRALARGALIPAMTKIELPDDKPVNLRPKTGEFQGANWALAPMLPQGATSWSLQLTAGADLGSADPRAVDPASRGSLVLADSHASTRMKIVPGGVGLVYAPNDLGYPWASRWTRTGSAIATSSPGFA